jgi:hypothetical protein
LNKEPTMNQRLLRSAAAGVLLLSLAACGGGHDNDDDANADDSRVPASALASWEAFTRWVGDRPASDRAEPVSVGDIDAPTSDSDDPIDGG